MHMPPLTVKWMVRMVWKRAEEGEGRIEEEEDKGDDLHKEKWWVGVMGGCQTCVCFIVFMIFQGFQIVWCTTAHVLG